MIPVVSALTSGGSLVAHSAGGLIVYSTAASGYVAGTYISTAALASFLTGSTVVAGAAGTAAVGGAVMWGYGTIAGATISLIGSAGIFGTSIGATGLTGLLMSAGIIATTPIWLPVAIFSGALLLPTFGVYYAHRVCQLQKKATSTPDGSEATFTAGEAKLAEKVIKSAASSHSWIWHKLMLWFGHGSLPNNPT